MTKLTERSMDRLHTQWLQEEQMFKHWLHLGQRIGKHCAQSLASDAQSSSPLLHQVESFFHWVEHQVSLAERVALSQESRLDWQTTLRLPAVSNACQHPWYLLNQAVSDTVQLRVLSARSHDKSAVTVCLESLPGNASAFQTELAAEGGRPVSIALSSNGIPVLVSEGEVHPSGLAIRADGFVMSVDRPEGAHLHLSLRFLDADHSYA